MKEEFDLSEKIKIIDIESEGLGPSFSTAFVLVSDVKELIKRLKELISDEYNPEFMNFPEKITFEQYLRWKINKLAGKKLMTKIQNL
jgi:hypothetical protein